MDGVLNIHKTSGPTSHDVVNEVRRLFGQKRVGHAGTLDPMATGVLVVALGRATRIVEYIMGRPKEYRARLLLGKSTDTQDSTGEVVAESDASGITREALESAITRFIGEIDQVPPTISAIKYQGKPLYKHAREGRIIEREARKVTIYSISVLDFTPGNIAEAELLVKCGSGTYIRTLCSDIGEVLGCGGHMSVLERTAVGSFKIQDAVSTADLAQAKSDGRLESYVIDMSDTLQDMPAVYVEESNVERLLNGLAIESGACESDGSIVRMLSPEGELLAMGVVDSSGGRRVVKPRKVLARAAD